MGAVWISIRVNLRVRYVRFGVEVRYEISYC